MAHRDRLTLRGPTVLDARAKHRWLTACAQYRPFVDKPGVLRLAIVIFELFDPGMGYAWPSRRYLSERLGSPGENIRRISALRLAGALDVVPAGQRAR